MCYELQILNFLNEYSSNGVIDMEKLSLYPLAKSLHDFSQEWEERYSSREEMADDIYRRVHEQLMKDKVDFQNFYKKWKENLKYSLWNDGNLKEFFTRKGDKYSKIFGIVGIIVSVLLVIFVFAYLVIPYIFYIFFLSILAAFLMFTVSKRSIYKKIEQIQPFVYSIIIIYITYTILWPLFYNPDNFPSNFVSFSLLVLGLSLIFSIVVPQKLFDQWTPYGKEYYERWMAFKRYIDDFSLIKEYPPDSIKLWNKYLVYATALGSAEGVRKAMEKSLPISALEGNDIYGFQKYDNIDNIVKDAILTAFDMD